MLPDSTEFTLKSISLMTMLIKLNVVVDNIIYLSLLHCHLLNADFQNKLPVSLYTLAKFWSVRGVILNVSVYMFCMCIMKVYN